MLSGEKFPGKSEEVADILSRKLTGNLKPLSSVPEYAQPVVMRLLQASIKGRWGSCVEFLSALQKSKEEFFSSLKKEQEQRKKEEKQPQEESEEQKKQEEYNRQRDEERLQQEEIERDESLEQAPEENRQSETVRMQSEEIAQSSSLERNSIGIKIAVVIGGLILLVAGWNVLLGKNSVQGDGYKAMLIPAGSFTMGCIEGDSDCDDDEQPSHEVTITNDFYLMESEVTQELYYRVIGTANLLSSSSIMYLGLMLCALPTS